jgi:rubredoxin
MTDIEEVRECPMCGEKMRREARDTVDLIPGTSEAKKRLVIEWVCPECDYFEEGEEKAKV